LPVLRRKAAELDKAGLVRMQLQAELRKPLPKIIEEPSCITEVLEPDDKSSANLTMITSPYA
jgi:hypothetical protein